MRDIKLNPKDNKEGKSWISTKLIIIPISLVCSTFLLWLIVYFRPELRHNENANLGFPSNLEEVKYLFSVLMMYKERNSLFVLLLFSFGYIYKQTFAIPGSALMNILAGAVFGCFPFGILLCCILTTIGASNCFLLSKYSGKDVVQQKFPYQITWLEEKLHNSQSPLFFNLIALRLLPATPNWLLNIICPIVNVPLPMFSLSVFLGLMPYNYLCLKTGETLSEIESFEEVLTLKYFVTLLALSVMVWFLSTYAKDKSLKSN